MTAQPDGELKPLSREFPHLCAPCPIAYSFDPPKR